MEKAGEGAWWWWWWHRSCHVCSFARHVGDCRTRALTDSRVFLAQVVCPSLNQRYDKIRTVAMEIEREIEAATTGKSVTEHTKKTAEARRMPIRAPRGFCSDPLASAGVGRGFSLRPGG